MVKLAGTNRMFARRSAPQVAASRIEGQSKLECSDHQNYPPPSHNSKKIRNSFKEALAIMKIHR